MNALETVTLGAEYLDRAQSRFEITLDNWRNKIDVDLLDVDNVRRCVLGQLFGTYDKALDLLNFSEDESPEEMGFAPNWQYGSGAFTTAWKEYLAAKVEAPKPVEYRRNRYGANVYRSLSVVVSSNGTERVAYEPVAFVNGVEKSMGNVGLWLKENYYEDTTPFEPVRWAEGDLLLADKDGKVHSFVVRPVPGTGLRPWSLREFPVWSDEATWATRGYTNFRKIKF